MPFNQEVAPAKVGVQYVVGTPPSTPILRPLRQPIYDQDIYQLAGTRELRIFVDNSTFPSDTSLTKDERNTNLTSPGQLGTPLEFDLVGFVTEIERGITLADHRTLYNNCVFRFIFGQTTEWLKVRLSKMPEGISTYGMTTRTATDVIGNGWPVVNNFYNFSTIDKKARRIRSTETFRNLILNPASSTIAADAQVTTYLLGALYGQL